MYYKFLDSRDVDRVLVDGTIMVSSLSYFRKLEAHGDIGDALEGASELTIRRGMTLTEGSPELAMINAANIGLGMFRQFAEVSNGGTITICPDVRFIHTLPDWHIYSFAQGDLDKLTRHMCIEAPLPYDACLRIKDPDALVRACLYEGTVTTLAGRRSVDVFQGAMLGALEYVPRTIDITEGSVLAPDPFKKEERFSVQSKARFVFDPLQGTSIAENRLIIAIPDPAAHFELMFRKT